MLKYKIISTTDKDGNEKIVPQEWIEPEYALYIVRVGRSAWLQNVNSDRSLKTSTVEEVFIMGNHVSIVTRNTIYHLSPVGSE